MKFRITRHKREFRDFFTIEKYTEHTRIFGRNYWCWETCYWNDTGEGASHTCSTLQEAERVLDCMINGFTEVVKEIET